MPLAFGCHFTRNFRKSALGFGHLRFHSSIVPADRKWFRDYVVAQMVVDTMEEWNLKWPKPRADLRKFRVK